MTTMKYIEGGLHIFSYTEEDDHYYEIDTFTEEAQIISKYLLQAKTYNHTT